MFAGIMHFVKPKMFVRIVPPYIPKHSIMVMISGVLEILLGIGVLFPKTQSWSALGLMILLVAVFPANIYMAQKFYQKGHKYTWVTIARLPLQLLLIYWAYLYY